MRGEIFNTEFWPLCTPHHLALNGFSTFQVCIYDLENQMPCSKFFLVSTLAYLFFSINLACCVLFRFFFTLPAQFNSWIFQPCWLFPNLTLIFFNFAGFSKSNLCILFDLTGFFWIQSLYTFSSQPTQLDFVLSTYWR